MSVTRSVSPAARAFVVTSRARTVVAVFHCGALESGEVTATNTIFLDNSAGGNGGGACISFGSGSLRGVHFKNNRAGGQGGGLYASGGASLVITSSEFISNSALSQGGGISIIGVNVDLVNSLFARNQSIDGAALALNGLSNRVNLVHNTIADTSLNPGQAIAVFNGTVGITDTIIVNHNIAIARTGGSVFEDYNLFFGNTFTVAGTVASGGHSL